MAVSKINWVDLTVDAPVVFDHMNSLGNFADNLYDVFVENHDADGTHNDDILCRGWAQVEAADGSPSYNHVEGTIASGTAITDHGTGDYTITLTDSATATTAMGAQLTVISSSATTFGVVEFTAVNTIRCRFYDSASEAATDVDFCISVWINI